LVVHSSPLIAHCYGGCVAPPFGAVAGGQGLRGVGVIPGVPGCVEPLPWVFPGAAGVWLELDPSAFGVAPGVPLVVPGVVPGKVPHGEPLGEVPGVVEVFGLTVEG